MKQKRVDERLKKQVRKKLKRKNVVSAVAGGDTVTVEQNITNNITQGVDNLYELNDVVLGDYPADGDVLTYDSASEKWVNEPSASGFSDPMTTRGDIIIRNSSNTTARLAIGTSGYVLTSDGTDISWAAASGGGGFWTALPTMTRVSGTQFTIPDTSNAGNWDKKLRRLRVIKWTDTTVHVGIVTSSSYSSDVVTVNIAGDTLDNTFTTTSGYYTISEVTKVTFAVAGTIATATNLSRKFYADCAYRVLLGKANHGTAGTTNATTYDLNKNGTTMFTTKLSVSSADTTGDDTSADNDTSLANEDYVTLDCDSVSTTAPVDAYIDLYLFPTNNIYL